MKEAFLNVYEGMLLNKEHGVYMNNPCLVIDKETGTLLKMGDELTSNIKKYYDTMMSQYFELGIDIDESDIVFIKLDRYNGVLDIDEICTLINYMHNSIGKERMNALLEMDDSSLKAKIKELQDIGF